MASPLLDFKKFKHVKSDDKSTTLQHKDGHLLTIHHNALSKQNQAQLKALSNVGKENQTESQKQESDPHYGKTVVKEATGGEIEKAPQAEASRIDTGWGKVIMRANGGEIKDAVHDRPDAGWGKVIIKDKAEGGEVTCHACGSPVRKYAEGDVVEPEMQPVQDVSPINISPEDLVKAGFKPRETADDRSLVGTENKGPMQMTPSNEPAQQKSNIPQDPGIAPQAPAPGPTDATNQDMLGSAYKQGIAGAKQMATATGQLGEANAEIQRKQAEAQQMAIKHYDEDKNALNAERLGHIQAIQDGKIDPSKYWDDHSKLATGIGLILAGFNPTSNPNGAVNFLKTQMEQNLTAQSKNLDSQQNLLSANLRQFGNLKDAADMTRVMQADYVSHKLGEAAAKAATPMAKAAALTAQSQINKEFQPLFMNLNMRRAAMSIASTPGEHSDNAIQQMISGLNSVGNPLGKTMGEAYIPGVGLSRTLQPIPEGTKKEVLAMKILDDKGKDVLNYINQHKGVWNSEKDKSVVNQKVEEMKNFYNSSIQGGALTEGRLGWYDEQFSKHPLNAVSQFLGSTAKLKEMVDSNGHRLNMTLDQQGINPLKSVGTHDQEIKIVNGVKYMRGPNGKAIPVK